MACSKGLEKGVIVSSQGFRPFFLGSGLWALLSMGLWIAILWGWVAPPVAFSGSAWHAHEMIVSFAGAAIAGFLLTAVPNWTDQPPLKG